MKDILKVRPVESALLEAAGSRAFVRQLVIESVLNESIADVIKENLFDELSDEDKSSIIYDIVKAIKSDSNDNNKRNKLLNSNFTAKTLSSIIDNAETVDEKYNAVYTSLSEKGKSILFKLIAAKLKKDSSSDVQSDSNEDKKSDAIEKRLISIVKTAFKDDIEKIKQLQLNSRQKQRLLDDIKKYAENVDDHMLSEKNDFIDKITYIVSQCSDFDKVKQSIQNFLNKTDDENKAEKRRASAQRFLANFDYDKDLVQKVHDEVDFNAEQNVEYSMLTSLEEKLAYLLKYIDEEQVQKIKDEILSDKKRTLEDPEENPEKSKEEQPENPEREEPEGSGEEPEKPREEQPENPEREEPEKSGKEEPKHSERKEPKDPGKETEKPEEKEPEEKINTHDDANDDANDDDDTIISRITSQLNSASRDNINDILDKILSESIILESEESNDIDYDKAKDELISKLKKDLYKRLIKYPDENALSLYNILIKNGQNNAIENNDEFKHYKSELQKFAANKKIKFNEDTYRKIEDSQHKIAYLLLCATTAELLFINKTERDKFKLHIWDKWRSDWRENRARTRQEKDAEQHRKEQEQAARQQRKKEEDQAFKNNVQFSRYLREHDYNALGSMIYGLKKADAVTKTEEEFTSIKLGIMLDDKDFYPCVGITPYKKFNTVLFEIDLNKNNDISTACTVDDWLDAFKNKGLLKSMKHLEITATGYVDRGWARKGLDIKDPEISGIGLIISNRIRRISLRPVEGQMSLLLVIYANGDSRKKSAIYA